jgi:arsenate reductase
MVKVYGIKNCDSVRKAVKFLKEHQIAYEFIDFRSTPVTCSAVHAWLEKADISALFNTRGTTYRSLKLKEMSLNDEEKAHWLCKENMLIKRPVIEYGDKVLVGFDQNNYERELLS